MCDCDGNGPEISAVKVVMARKAHKCCECRREIAAGQQYEYTWGIWDGDSASFKTCLACVALRKWAEDQTECFCWTYGDVHHQVLDEMHECDPKHTGLYLKAKARMAAIRAPREEVCHS